jgi:hypothetical protein
LFPPLRLQGPRAGLLGLWSLLLRFNLAALSGGDAL